MDWCRQTTSQYMSQCWPSSMSPYGIAWLQWVNVSHVHDNYWKTSYQICKCQECRERFPRNQLQRELLVSDPGIHHGTCVTHVPWCMSGSLTRSGGENVPGIPGACATRNFANLVRGPCIHSVSIICFVIWLEQLRHKRLRCVFILTTYLSNFSWGCYDGWRGGRTPEPRVYDVKGRYDDIHRLGQSMPLRMSHMSPAMNTEWV